jgi:hypothetical protein
MSDPGTGRHVLVSHARFRECCARRRRVVAEFSRQARDQTSPAEVLIGVVEPDDPERPEAPLAARGLRLVSASISVLATERCSVAFARVASPVPDP